MLSLCVEIGASVMLTRNVRGNVDLAEQLGGLAMGKPTPYRASVVVPLPDEGVIARSFGNGYDPDTALNVLKMMSGTGDFFPALIGMVNAVFGECEIDAKHREVIILRAASVLNCPYEWQANEQMARNAGLTTSEIDTIAGDGAPTLENL